MKVSIKGNFELGMTEVPEDMAKDLESKLKQINSEVMNFDVKVENDEPQKTEKTGNEKK
jgi:hypothetical protein